MLPRLVADLPVPSAPPRARSLHYSWPWTEQMIERDTKEIDALAAALDDVIHLNGARRRSAYEKMLSDYRRLSQSQRTIESHIQYNRLWQQMIARDRAGYDRQTVLHDAVIERQGILDALGAGDEATFRKAVAGIAGIDARAARDVLEVERESARTGCRGADSRGDRRHRAAVLSPRRSIPRRISGS